MYYQRKEDMQEDQQFATSLQTVAILMVFLACGAISVPTGAILLRLVFHIHVFRASMDVGCVTAFLWLIIAACCISLSKLIQLGIDKTVIDS